MDAGTVLAIAALFFLGATIYTSVGHAGASAYLAIMALFSVAPETMRPTALVLNIVVAALATFRYVRAEQFNFRLFLPFALAALPFAFIGGAIHLPTDVYKKLIGAVLLLAAARFLLSQPDAGAWQAKPPPLWAALSSGAGIGLIAGLTGTGGGIFLSPLVLICKWEAPRRTSGVAAAFILVNSIAGLAGNFASVGALPRELPYFLAAVLAGAMIGTRLGVAALTPRRLLQVLGIVLIVAGLKLILA